MGKPNNLKEWIRDNKIYDVAINSILDKATNNSLENPSSALNQPEIQKVIKETLTSEVARTTTEQIIDGTYNWMRGDVDKPNYAIDLTSLKNTFAEKAGNVAEQRFVSLPICTITQLRQLTGITDPFVLSCRPPGINIAAEKQKITDQIFGNQDLLPDPIITADTIKMSGDNKPVYKTLKQLPWLYQFLQKAPWIFGILAVLLAIGIVFISPSRRKGLYRVAVSLMINGVLFGISALFIIIATYWVGSNKDLIKNANPDLQSALIGLGKSIANSIDNVLLSFSVVFIVLGGAVLLYLYWTRPKFHNLQPEQPEQPIEELPPNL
ncbi:hypothetical protein HY003_01500 [Candidatus Saccharibacteria bacterium]|nr:hypothetical protein [Candidatus Saccharibacteria bacterium]MBI3337950.1 hypothetical protein [Candidatus Saccharibacteria bacterium]